MVRTLAIQPDGKIVIGGNFTTVAGNPRLRIARLNTNGSLDFDFLAGTSADDTVNAVAVQPDGRILLAGAFTTVRSFNRRGIARIGGEGELDASFDPGTGINGVVHSIALLPDGRVDDTFQPGFSTNGGGIIYAVAPLSNGQTLAGGNFTEFNNHSALRLMRLLSGNETAPPTLWISLAPNGQKILHWDAQAAGWTLQHSGTLTNDWQPLGAPLTGPGSHPYIGGEGKQFFRLGK